MRIRAFFFSWLLLGFTCLTNGCGSGGSSTVSGDVIPGGTIKMGDGDKIVILLNNESKNYSTESDSSGKFSISNVSPGIYKVKIVHYTSLPSVPTGSPSGGNKGGAGPLMKGGPGENKGSGQSGPNQPVDYPEDFVVPGGPYKIELSKVKAK